MPIEQVETRDKVELVFPNRYNVLLLNDDYTPMDFVIQLLVEVFNRTLDEATSITMKVHEEGQGIAGTYSHEVAEQKGIETTLLARQENFPLQVKVKKQ